MTNKEIQTKGEIRSQAGTPYDSTKTDYDASGDKRAFILTPDDKKYEKFFKDTKQYDIFISLPLTEAQRVKFMSKMQALSYKEALTKTL